MADNDRLIKIAAVQDTPVFFNIHESTKKVLNYLEMEPRKVSTPHVKVNTTPLRELITNYDEFIEFIHEQKWDHYISDQS